MKVQVQVSSTNSPVEYLREVHRDTGKMQKKVKKDSGSDESQAIKAYLNKLQDLVPYTPKNKKLSKVEVISYVIDYIQDLRETLGLPPSPTCQNGNDVDDQFTWMFLDSNASDETSSLVEPSPPNTTMATIKVTSVIPSTQPHRQPLCVISNPGNTDPSCTSTSSSVKSPIFSSTASCVIPSSK